MDDHLILEICRVKLQEALDSKKKDKMIASLKYANSILPYSVSLNGVDEARVIIYSKGKVPVRVKYDDLNLVNARWNVQGFIAAIDQEFMNVQCDSYRARFARVGEILDKQVEWQKEDVLYQKDANVLNVENFLSVCSYAIKVGQTIDPKDELYDEASAAVSVFKGLECVMNNKSVSNNIPKMLHLANDFLLVAVKPSLEKRELRQDATNLSLFVDLVIDFLSSPS